MRPFSGKAEDDGRPVALDYDYLDRVRRVATLVTRRKTSDLLEGDFRSMQHGRSLEFDDLREYRFGDDVSDIDWKSSSRTGKTLIRRNVAERRHDVMIVGDTGLKMTGDTPDGESKEHIALMTFGITAYLLGKQGVNYALAYHTERGDTVSPFLSGPAHLEELLYGYKQAIEESAKCRPDAEHPVPGLPELLRGTVVNIPKRMILIILTDMDGLAGMDERLVRLLVYRNDVYVVHIRDAFLTTEDAFDLTGNLYEDPYLTGSRELRRAETAYRKRLREKTEKLFARYRVPMEHISREEEIVDRIAGMFRVRREMG